MSDYEDALIKIVNASYGELRPFIEQYAFDVRSNTVREFATDREWEVARAVASYFQRIAGNALAAVEAREPADTSRGVLAARVWQWIAVRAWRASRRTR